MVPHSCSTGKIQNLILLVALVLPVKVKFTLVRVWHAGLLHQLSLTEFWGSNWALFCLFSVVDGFDWFLMGILKNIKLMLEFLKAPFLVSHFSYYTLMTFLMMLSVILLSMLMILFSTLSVIRHLIHSNN